MTRETIPTLFALFTEIGIIEQLSRNLFQARLPEGMLVSHFGVLNHLARGRDGQTPLAIANAFQVPKTTMTHTLSGLEKSGMIRMTANPEDGRSKCVWLTDKGRAFREQAIAALAPDLARMASALPEEEIRSLLPGLARLRAYLDELRD